MSNVAIRSLTGIKFGDVSFVTSSTYSISVFSAGASGFHSENTNPASPANAGTVVIVITIIRAVSTRIHFFMSEYLLNYDVCNRRISDLYPFPVRPVSARFSSCGLLSADYHGKRKSVMIQGRKPGAYIIIELLQFGDYDPVAAHPGYDF